MMGSSKPMASLSSGLLARKGQARPAMRPQGFSGFGSINGAIDDLGWNDMGEAMGGEPNPPVPLHPIEPMPAPTRVVMPPVLRDRAALAEEYAAHLEAEAEAIEAEPVEVERELEPEPAPVIQQLVQPKRPRSAPPAAVPATVTAKNKAAFTLRLDEERHLRLRLASAVMRQSAQQIVTAALDAWLDQLPEVEAMAARAVRSDDHQAKVGD